MERHDKEVASTFSLRKYRKRIGLQQTHGCPMTSYNAEASLDEIGLIGLGTTQTFRMLGEDFRHARFLLKKRYSFALLLYQRASIQYHHPYLKLEIFHQRGQNLFPMFSQRRVSMWRASHSTILHLVATGLYRGKFGKMWLLCIILLLFLLHQ